MKKIVCLLLCLITYNAYADNLLDAIRSRDVPTVKQLLANNDFNVDYYDIYVTAIEESLWMARERMFMQRWRPETDTLYSSLYLCSVLASLGGFTWAASNNHHSWVIFFMALPFITLPLAIKGAKQATKSVQQHYKDVLHIQDLVLTTFADLA